MKENLLEMEAEHRRLRRIAFIAVAVSTVAVFSSVITLPIVYSYLQGLQTHIGAEVDFCKFKSRDMWLEVSAVQDTMAENSSTRQRRSIPVDQRSKRAWMFGKWMNSNYETVQSPRPAEGYGASSSSYGSPTPPPVSGYDAPVVNSEPLIQQCTCQFGPPGEAGEPGDDGIDGKDGAPGLDGADGREGQILAATQAHNEPCIICPVGSPGPAGAPGAKGPPGPKGAPGLQAPNGKNGDPGMVGSAGPTGRAGREGPRGQPGAPGIVRIVPGPLGPPGAQGPPGITGLKGPTGAPGSPGKTGEPGLPGEQGLPGLSGREGPHGDKGPVGSPGPKGECNCPPPRLPPGY